MHRFFTDECIPTDIVLALRQEGFEITTVKEAGLIGADDDVVFDFALDKSLILITFDRGFGDIFRFNISKSAGIIIVLINRMSKEDIVPIIINFILFSRDRDLSGQLALVSKSKIRISER